MNAQHRLVGLPAVFVGAHERQIAIVDELAELRDGTKLASLLLRIGAEQSFGKNLAALAPRLVHAEHMGCANFVLALAAAIVGIALVIGFAAGATHLEKKAALAEIEIIGLPAPGRATGPSHEACGQHGNSITRLCLRKSNSVGKLQ